MGDVQSPNIDESHVFSVYKNISKGNQRRLGTLLYFFSGFILLDLQSPPVT